MSITTQTIVAGAKKYPIIVVCAVLSLALLAILYTRSDLIAEQEVQLEESSKTSRRYRTNVVSAIQLQDQLDFLVGANAAVKERAFTVGGLAQNLQYFYRLEADTGIKYLDLRPGGRSAAAAIYQPLNYIVNIQGDFPQVITYLKRLEQGANFCRINSAVISSSNSIATLNLNLDLLGVQ